MIIQPISRRGNQHKNLATRHPPLTKIKDFHRNPQNHPLTIQDGLPTYVNVININIETEETNVNWFTNALTQARNWLDERGKAAWITAMVLGFIFVWPLGLAILFYMIGSGRMGHKSRYWRRGCSAIGAHGATGNTAFDEYRAETLKRLEEEQNAFTGFLDELRAAKDKAEFDQFMSERGRSDEAKTAPAV